MGLWMSTYFGPVVLAEYSIGSRTTKIRKCVNEKCSRRKPITDGAKFCPQCGELIKSVDGPSEKIIIPEWEDVENAFIKADLDCENLDRDNFISGPEGYHLYLPNSQSLNRETIPDDPKNCYIDMAEIDMEAEKQWLQESYASEIEVLKSVYKSVVIKWIFTNSLS